MFHYTTYLSLYIYNILPNDITRWKNRDFDCPEKYLICIKKKKRINQWFWLEKKSLIYLYDVL